MTQNGILVASWPIETKVGRVTDYQVHKGHNTMYWVEPEAPGFGEFQFYGSQLTLQGEIMPSTTIQWFKYDHLPASLHKVSKPFYDLAHQMEELLPDGPEKSAGMRKLLEAKDCAVRAFIILPTEAQNAE